MPTDKFLLRLLCHHHHHHHQSLFIHEIVSFYMVFLGIVFKTRLKYSRELLSNVKNTKTYIMNNKS